MTTSGGSTRKPAGSRDVHSASSLSSLWPGEPIQTSASLPVLLIYLPQHHAIQAELLLAQNSDFTHPIQRQLFSVPTPSGLWRITVQADDQLTSLSLNSLYDWQLTLISKIPGRGQPPTITGQIQRVAIATEVQSQLNQITPQERVFLYQSVNLLHDACVELDRIRRVDATNDWAQTTWSSWMRDRGWDQFVAAPTIGEGVF